MKNKIQIEVNGVLKDAHVLMMFKNKEQTKEYIVYTFLEEEADLVRVYASLFKEKDYEYSLEDIDDADWQYIKTIMREVIKESAND